MVVAPVLSSSWLLDVLLLTLLSSLTALVILWGHHAGFLDSSDVHHMEGGASIPNQTQE
jgi:hypothetical protein